MDIEVVNPEVTGGTRAIVAAPAIVPIQGDSDWVAAGRGRRTGSAPGRVASARHESGSGTAILGTLTAAGEPANPAGCLASPGSAAELTPIRRARHVISTFANWR